MTLPIFGDGTLHLHDIPSVGGKLNVSIVTRVKDRKHHLLEALPTWLKVPVAEIVIVDWDSKDANLRDYLNYIKDDRVKVVQIRNKRTFDRSEAWNVGINHASAEWVMLLDCDIKINNNPFADPIFSLPNYDTFYRLYAVSHAPHLYGCCALLKEQWVEVGGFNEDLEGWGWEDVDFFERMRAKYKEVTLTLSHYQSIPHSDEERTLAHDEKNLRVSLAKNAYRARTVESISLVTIDDGFVHQAGASIKLVSYRQTITYRKSAEHLHAVLSSAKFKSMVKKYNLFNKPEEIKELFEMEEFKDLESMLLKESLPVKKAPRSNKNLR